MEDSLKKLIKDLTEILNKHGLDKNEIADIIVFTLSIQALGKMWSEIDGLYDVEGKS